MSSKLTPQRKKVFKKLFEFPLQLVIVGRTRSGKSHLLRNTIIPSIMSQYDDVFIFSPTAFLDAGWKKIKSKYKEKVTFFPEFDNDQVIDFIEGIGENKDDESNEKYLLIFDDVTDRLSQSLKSYFTKIAIFGRHYNISYIVTSHKFRALNTTMRNNATSKIFFKINSNPEMEAVTDELATANVNPDELKSIISRNTGNFSSFLIKCGPDDDDYFKIDKNAKVTKLVNKKRKFDDDDDDDVNKKIKDDV